MIVLPAGFERNIDSLRISQFAREKMKELNDRLPEIEGPLPGEDELPLVDPEELTNPHSMDPQDAAVRVQAKEETDAPPV